MIDLKSINLDQIKDLLSDEKTRIQLAFGVTAALALLYLTFAVVPKFFSLAETAREIKQLNANIDLVNSRVKRLDEMTRNLKTLRAEVKGYAKGLPGKKEIPRFLEELSQMAKKSGVKILSITPEEIETPEPGKTQEGVEYYREMPILVTAKSGYHQLGHFINDLEEGERFVTIKDIRIQTDTKFPRKHNIKIILKTYVATEDEKTTTRAR